jgi:L-2-hydroxyglutarate oxidase
MKKHDVIIIGAGIVGLATAYNILKTNPDLEIIILEKENKIALHQTGRNSGVIHSGIYYKPGSLKAMNCRAGKKLLEEFCLQEGVPFETSGKIIIATEESELERLNNLYQRGVANGVNCRIIEQAEIKELEPYVNGIKAIHVPEAGIIDYLDVCNKLAGIITDKGGSIKLSEKVVSINDWIDEIIINTTKDEYRAKYLINCSGLYSDHVAKLSGFVPGIKIIPFRGEYYQLQPEAEYLCNNLIYPVPDPAFPFLGVHFTRMLKGGVECGPNAVLAMAREGYHKTDINWSELAEILNYPGMRKIAYKHWKTGLGEVWRSISKKAFTKALSRLIPAIREKDLIPIEAGIRAQAVAPDGAILDDFYIQDNKRIINVLNAPSPAATASFNIGRVISEMLLEK